MKTPLRVLIVGNSESDAKLVLRQLKKAEYSVHHERVETAKDMQAALKKQTWEIVISDYKLSRFQAPAALSLLHKTKLDIPFIVVSGAIGEESAVELMKLGANDYLMKDKLERLVPVVKRELAEAQVRQEHKRSEEALTESEAQLSMIYNNVNDAIFTIAVESKDCFRFTSVNHRFLELTGLSEDQVVGRLVQDVIPKPALILVLKKYREAIHTRQSGRWEETSTYPTGEKIGEVTIAPIFDKNRICRQLIGTVHDITERKQVEETLAKEQFRMNMLMDSIPDHIYFKDTESRFIRMNKAQSARFRLSAAADAIGKTDFDFFTEEHARSAFEDEQKIMKTGQSLIGLEEKETWPDGSVTWVTTTKMPLRNKEGEIIGTFGISSDITERKQAEEALQERDNRFNKLASQVPGMIYQFMRRPDGTFCVPFTSEGIRDIFGCSPQDVRNDFSPIAKIIVPEDLNVVINSINNSAQHLTPWHCEYKVQLPGQSIRWLYGQSMPEKLNDGSIIWHGFNTDITERKRTEVAQRESMQLFQGLFKSSPDAIVLIDPHHQRTSWPIVDCNEAACQMNGYTYEELVGQSIDVLNTSAGTPEERIAYFENIRQKGIIHFETYHRHKDGHIFPVEVSTSIVSLGGREMVLGIDRDVTERKQAETELQKSKTQLSNAIKIAKLGPWEYDVAKDTFTFNDSFFAIFRTTADQVGGYTMSSAQYAKQFVYPDDLPMVGEEIKKAIETTDPHYSCQLEHRILYADGKIGYIAVRILVVKDAQGRTIKTYGVNQDITERKQAEEALRQSKESYRKLFEDHSAVKLIIDPDTGMILDANHAASQYYGWTRHDLKQMNIDQINTLSPEEVKIEMEKARVHKRIQFEFRHRRADGSIRDVEVFSSKIEFDGNEVLHSIVHDITERKRVENALRQAEEQYRAIFENAVEGIFQSTPEGIFLAANPMMARILGYSSPEELIRERLDIEAQFYVDPHGRGDFKRRIETYGVVTNFEYEARRKDGSSVWVSENARVVRDDCGRVICYEGSLEDITERKRTEEVLRESMQLFRDLFNVSPDAIILIDPHSQSPSWPIVDCNEAACQMNGYTREELVGHSIDTLNTTVGTPEERIAYFENIRQKGIIHMETTHRHKDGHVFPIEVSTSIVSLGGCEMVLGIDRDITERKRAEKALTESQALYHSFVEHLPAGVFRKDREGRYVFVNSYFCRLKGLKEDEILGKTPYELAAYESAIENSRPSEMKGIQRTLANQGMDHHKLIMNTGKHIELEELYPQPDGTIKYFQVVKSPVFASDGKIIGSQGVQFDITERKRTEEARHESEKLFRDLFNASPDAITLIDPHHPGISWPIVDCNKAACQMNGYTREELVGHSIDVLNPVEGTQEERIAYIKNLRKKGTIHVEIFHRHKDGHIFPIEVSTTLITLGGREMVLGIDRDITERKKAEIELKESEERYRRLLEFSPDAIAVHSEGKIVYVNSAAITLLGANNGSELIGKPFLDIIHPESRDSVHQQIIAVMKEEYAIPLTEQKFIRLDGSCIEVEVAALPIIYKEKSAMQIVVRDISEQKKLQKQLIQTQKIQSIGTLAGGIAHDFNNILGIILAYSSLLSMNTVSPDKFANSINAINQAVQRGAALVRQILTFARKTDIVFEPMDISELIHELLSMLEQTFPKTITFSESIADNLPFIFADRTQVHQALLNLCINARDAMPDGGSISIATGNHTKEQMIQQFPAADAEAYVCLTVTDTGKGMDETTRLRVFDPFFTTKEKGKGTGLGLSVVYGVVQAHHGFIDLKSEPGFGTTFRLFFPVPTANEQTVDSQESTQSFEIGGTETILFVEDEDMLVQMVTFLLESKGYKVHCAHDGLEAVNVYQSHKQEIALVLTDMGLPVLTGSDEFKKLKEINPDVKVIFASGYFEPDLKSELLKDGANGFIQKPYEPDHILRMIRQVLDQKV